MLANLAVQLLNVHVVTGLMPVLRTALAVSATSWLVNQLKPSFSVALAPCRIIARNSYHDSYRPTGYR